MAFLVADIGGTNTRIALADTAGVRVETIRRYRNRDHGSVPDILADYLALQGAGAVKGCCIAVAGPVTSRSAKLTNLNWTIDAGEIQRLTSCDRITLVNDLAALGNAAEYLAGDQIVPIKLPHPDATTNNQSLIVGIGTGLNVCAVHHHPNSPPTCLAAEYGHCGLPVSLSGLLRREFGSNADEFQTLEDCFSGRGLARMYTLASGGGQKVGTRITQSYTGGDDPVAIRVVDFYARLFGGLCRELLYQYLPLNGIFIAGSVARGVLGAVGLFDIGSDATARPGFSQQFDHVPVSLITDDAAGLLGCQRLIRVGH